MSKQGIRAEGRVMLRVLPDQETGVLEQPHFTIEAPGVEGYILGRSDVSTSYIPDVDLGEFRGQQKGISRRHAALIRYRNLVHILDLDSVNGTFINGTRLAPMVAYPLNPGDQVSLANLSMIISHK